MLLGQFFVLQNRFSVNSPQHVAYTQVRLRVWFPPPQLTLQAPQAFQFDHEPPVINDKKQRCTQT